MKLTAASQFYDFNAENEPAEKKQVRIVYFMPSDVPINQYDSLT